MSAAGRVAILAPVLQDLLPFAIWLLEATVVGLTVAGAWKTFEKRGERGWAVLVPFYNAFVLCRAAGRDGGFAFWLCVPCATPILLAVVSIGLAERLGRGKAFGLGLAYLPFIFYPIAGFSRAAAPSRQLELFAGTTSAAPPLPAAPPPLPAAPPPPPGSPTSQTFTLEQLKKPFSAEGS